MCFDLSPFDLQKQMNSFDGWIKGLGQATLPLEFTDMISIICDSVTERLRYLHSNNKAHRDLKPGNILLSNQHISKLQTTKALEWKPFRSKADGLWRIVG